MQTDPVTHAELVTAAVRWLRGTVRCSTVFSEWAPSSISEVPDAIGFDRSGRSVLVECKRTRSDFKADTHKMRTRTKGGMGLRRWYFTPPGLVLFNELPDGWGLAELRGQRVFVVREPTMRSWRDTRSELAMLAAAVWRHQNGIAWDEDRARFAPVPRSSG